MPRPIRTDREIFVDNFIFKFQNKLAGNRARSRSTTEQTADPN
jgi:hypothetical protein